MAALLVVKNKSISFLWELNSIFMYTLWKKKENAELTTNMVAMSRGMRTKNKPNRTHAA